MLRHRDLPRRYTADPGVRGKGAAYLGSLGDLLPLEIFGDFLPTQSSLSSMSLESEQLQLSIMEEISVLP